MTDPWVLIYDGFDAEQVGLREALCALGNGVFCTRGAAEESRADDVHYPGTYVAGGYDRLESEIAGQKIENEDLVNLPNWLPLTFRIDDREWVDLRRVEVLDHRLELRLREGVLGRRARLRDGEGRESLVESRRFVHMEKPCFAGIEWVLTPLNWSGRAVLRSSLDGSVRNAGVARYRQLASRHLRTIDRYAVAPEGIGLLVETRQSGIRVAEAARTRVFRGGERFLPETRIVEEEDAIHEELAVEARQGEPLRVEKIVALCTSRDRGITEAGLASRRAIERAGGFEELLESHRRAWAAIWRKIDVRLLDAAGSEVAAGGPGAGIALILRLHLFHLFQTVSPNTVGRDVGVPARGLHGEAYRGHVFWDELFIFPLLNLRFPEITRSLLLYRYHRLDGARALAAADGFRGAMYPWQSSSNGEEESQRVHLNPESGRWVPDRSHLQRHINAAIAYNVWTHHLSTGDGAFLERYGAEMIVEIARFWASAAVRNPDTGRYEIHGVMGPDEFHEAYPGAAEGGLRNNAYTNVMAVWCLDRAIEALESLRPGARVDLAERISLRSEELDLWRDVARRMTLVFHADGILSQFEGYEALPELDWDAYRRKYGDIHRLDRILKAEGDSPDRYKVSKQADVTMLFYLLTPKELRTIFERLGYPFDDGTIERNVRYYMQRTSHGSTLSRVVLASVLDRIDRAAGWTLFCEALRSDVGDVQGGTTREGIHLGAMAGTVEIILRHYLGLDTTGAPVAFQPRLPEALGGIALRVQVRGRWLDLRLTHDVLEVTPEADGQGPFAVGVGAGVERVEGTRRFPLS